MTFAMTHREGRLILLLAAADPISAAAASLSERGGLRLELPGAAAAPVVFKLPNGLRAELRQHGASGPGHLARGAVAYAGMSAGRPSRNVRSLGFEGGSNGGTPARARV